MNTQNVVVVWTTDQQSILSTLTDNSITTNPSRTHCTGPVLITEFPSEGIAETIKKINNIKNLKAKLLSDYTRLIRKPLHQHKELIKDFVKKETENEFFLLQSAQNATLFENGFNVEKESGRLIESKKIAVSSQGNFFVIFGETTQILCAKTLKIFYEFFESATGVEFSENDEFFAFYTKKSTKIYKTAGISCIYEIESPLKVQINSAKNYFFVDRGKKTFPISKKEKFPFSDKKIAILSTKNGKSVFLTDEKIPKLFFSDGKKEISKSQPNLDDVNFYWAENCVYLVKKVVCSRTLFFLERVDCDGISVFSCECKIESVAVSDKCAAILDEKGNLTLLVKENTLVPCAVLKKPAGSTLISVSPTVNVFCIYDKNTDLVEFYGDGEFIWGHKHSNCTSLKWSQSGLFVASISSLHGMNGLIQMFASSGKLLWKMAMEKACDFIWLPYLEFDRKEDVINDYENLVGDLNMDYLNIVTDESDVDVLKDYWLMFLNQKKRILLQGR